MIGVQLSEIIAVTIERDGGLPCGGCGGQHVETMQEWERCEHPCTCRCCIGVLDELIEAEYPDLITTRGGVRVVTRAAFHEMLRRMEAEIGSLEKDAA